MDRIEPVDLVANTIPAAATAAVAPALAGASRVVFDAVYDPWPTPLGEAARAHGRAALNGLDVSGRKLRVEYKKVLQAGEKERIEKE